MTSSATRGSAESELDDDDMPSGAPSGTGFGVPWLEDSTNPPYFAAMANTRSHAEPSRPFAISIERSAVLITCVMSAGSSSAPSFVVAGGPAATVVSSARTGAGTATPRPP